MKPRGKIDTPEKARAAREFLGLNKAQMARVARIDSRDTVRRIEEVNTRGVPGPYQIVLEALVSGWRPWGVKLPGDKGFKTMKIKLEKE
jgi:transcriptional regulator with XRE-family HTH domain